MSRFIAVLLLLFPECAYAATIDGRSCRALPDSGRARLIEYVRKKNKLPQAAPLTLNEVSLVGSTCFRKVEFRSEDPKRRFRVELFLSPDFRFLTRELMDSTVDPVLEERRRQQALAAGLTAGSLPVLGPNDAKVTMVVFSDFQCPYCARFARTLRSDVLPIEKRTRLVFRNFPLDGHNWARRAAEAAACAQEQGNDFFWRLHDFIFEQQMILTADNFARRIAEETARYRSFDQARFSGCIAARKTAGKVDADIVFASENGVAGTPTLFLNGERATLASSPEQIRSLIREASTTRPFPARR